MKKLVKPFLIALVAVFFYGCAENSNPSGQAKYKARLEVAGICSNYTFSVIEGNIDTSLVVAEWTDPQTDKTYKNAFAVKNPCILPTGIKKGDVFSFVINANPSKSECAVCMAYYPTPPKSLDIKVVK